MTAKRAQFESDDYTSLSYRPELRGKTLEDLYIAIRADSGLSPAERQRVLSQVQGMVGFSGSNTPISALMYKGLGGALGYLISKYFGMGPVGQVISAIAGYGLGKVLNDQLNKPVNPFPGFRML